MVDVSHFHTTFCVCARLVPSLKGFKRKEFAPRGSKFFPFRINPFSERKTIWELLPLKEYPFLLYPNTLLRIA